MRSRNLLSRKHRKILFNPRKMPPSTSEPADTLEDALRDKARITEVASSDSDYEDVIDGQADYGPPFPESHVKTHPLPPQPLPPWLHQPTYPLFHHELETPTSESQAKTLTECLPLLTGEDTQALPLNSHALPHLCRSAHANFLHATLQPLPSPYQVVDASRPWLLYWALAGLSFLGEHVCQYKERLVETLRPLQNPTGGFGGGHGQLSHCAGTYAAILSLALVDGLSMVDRRGMWEWLGQMKQADGAFTMAMGAEEDIRGAYCAMTILTLLNLPLSLPPDAPARKAGLKNFPDRLGEWVGRCQTYEGGIAGAPTNEAHGAYAFCALACLSILDAPAQSVPRYLDIDALLGWLAGIQCSPEGGFAGRTNKLVDACYSHWVGGCWSLLQAALGERRRDDEGEVGDLWNRQGLVRYLLCCCQQAGKKGGMRDKPSTRPDAYHTCYSLAGLSAAQNHYHYPAGGATKEGEDGRLLAAFNWTAEKADERERRAWRFDEQDRVEFVHPVFVLPMDVVERVRKQFVRGLV